MLAPAAHVPSARRGVLLVLLAVLIFACMDSMGKYLMTRFNVPLVSFIRYGLNVALLLIFCGPRQGGQLWAPRRTWLVVLRGFSLAVSSLLMGFALQRMPVAETVAIIYLAPFGVLLLAGPLLGERVGLAGWLAALAGFTGVLLIARPGSGLSTEGVLFAVAAAATSVGYILLSRKLAATESTIVMLFCTSVVGLVFFGFMMPWHWTGPAFELRDYVLLMAIGVGSLLGHYLFTAAYREAPASLLAPANYVHIAWAVVLGWIIYNHVPDAYALMGMAIIAVAGASIALRSQFAKNIPTEI